VSAPSPQERPTAVIPQVTAEQPAVTTAPATRRARVWQRKLPARLGPARTSTVVIGCLFVLLFALNSTLPTVDTTTVPVSYNGRTVNVPLSALPSDARPTSTTAPTPTPTQVAPSPTDAPAPTTSAAPTSQAPRTTATDEDDDPGTTAPTTTGESRQRSTAPSVTSRAPATTTAAPESSQPAEPSEEPQSSTTPTD
jgi:hypothetical protein